VLEITALHYCTVVKLCPFLPALLDDDDDDAQALLAAFTTASAAGR
jgi:hypothetical protein